MLLVEPRALSLPDKLPTVELRPRSPSLSPTARGFPSKKMGGAKPVPCLSGGVGSQRDLKVSIALALWRLSALFAAHGNLMLVSQTPVGF